MAVSDGIFGNDGGGGGAQAQLAINVYPSQDDPTKTLWIFRGTESRAGASNPFYGSSIRSSGNFHRRDSWKMRTNSPTLYYGDNKPTNQLVSLSPLFSSTNTIDIESVQTRLFGVSRGIFAPPTFQFHSSVTNTPTMAVFTNGVLSASKTIGSIFMNDAAIDEIGIRGAGGSNLLYATNDVFSWFGSGIMNKPISDFYFLFPSDTSASHHGDSASPPYFAIPGFPVRTYIYRHVIPEPAEYALVFGLFALAFVIVRRRFQKKGLN